MSPLWQLTLARFREFYREPAALFWVYGFPLILAFVLGLAFSEKPVPAANVDVVADPRHPEVTEKLRIGLSSDPGVKVEVLDDPVARKRLRTSKTDAVVIPRPETASGYEYLFDATRSESVLARNAADRALLRAAHPTPNPPVETATTEPGGRYIDFLIPGLLGMNLLGGGLFGVGFAVGDLRVRKLLKRFQATPMRRSDFMLSLMISRLVFTLIDIGLLLGFAYLAFGVKVRGNPLVFVGLIALGGASFAGIGLLLGSRARTMETIAGLVNAVMLPMYVLSGVFFSSARFPEGMQWFVQLLPLTALNDALRAVMNDGAGWEALPYPLLVLGVWGVLSFALALRIFRWR
ncbi:ABC transporter permease [Gemmata sp. JC717]|uniref:ABC transporter permease n=1 Tax=Gemmata algarum TaxID=2975278 RepID=A0ABU5F7Q1_9BACT|nr:ABC transporter permease [Gemmata algarum]MDY3553109.1 ABC transporter permease [Gemmata algarum]MDY3562772.1 ABC transporter permease [Gemmata algarum]